MGSARAGTPRRGPRPAGSDARGDILDGARRSFAAHGFAGASLRGIAREAGVDPALVHHYFAGKADLFIHAVLVDPERATFPGEVAARVLDGPHETIGVRWVREFLRAWDVDGGGERFRALIHGASGDECVLARIRAFLGAEVFARLVAATGSDHGPQRAKLAGTQVIGLGLARYVVRVPGIADADPDDLAQAIGPALQRYLDDDLPPRLLSGGDTDE